MEIYKNDYSRQEDEMLWEIHEIRHELSIEHQSMTIEEINNRANEYCNRIKNKYIQKNYIV